MTSCNVERFDSPATVAGVSASPLLSDHTTLRVGGPPASSSWRRPRPSSSTS
ncbi:hypothetical protein G7085_04370 [Tessaracoccus sp. HDW20]|nr:hypothetical protein [Tessaracoccus coleopterorum]